MQSACVIVSSVAYLALQYFSTLSHKRYDFRRKKNLLNIKCVFWFSLQFMSEAVFILRRAERHMIIIVNWSSSIVPVMLLRFKWKLNFPDISPPPKFPNFKFHENPSSGSRFVLCGKTDRHFEACSRFSQFCEHGWSCQLFNVQSHTLPRIYGTWRFINAFTQSPPLSCIHSCFYRSTFSPTNEFT